MTQKLLLILLVSIITYAQTSFVKVGYSLKIGYDEGLSIAEGLKDYYAMAQKGAEFVHFDLEVNKAASYFTMKETISNSETSFAISFSDASTSYYTEANSDLKIKYENDSFGEFRINYEDKTEWKLENETKYIDRYLCYKATSEQIVVNPVRTFKHPIVAWYCLSIPFSFGPKGGKGLPGLILELQVRNIIWGATKIEVSNEEKSIEKPTKGKLITEEEYKKMLSSPTLFER
jgi:GLPGLI family protein